MKRSTYCLFIIALIAFSIDAQEAGKMIEDDINVETIRSFDAKDYEGWQTVELESLSFRVPKEFKKIDDECKKPNWCVFESETSRINVDISIDAFRPTFEKKKYSSFNEKYYWVNEISGVYAWVWSFEVDDPKYSVLKYHSGALFVFTDSPDYLVNINVVSEVTDIRETAEKILRSATFKLQDQERD